MTHPYIDNAVDHASMKLVHEVIAAVCRKRGITAYELARRAGVPPQGVRRFLKGERGITTQTLDKLLEALELTVREASESRTERRSAGSSTAAGDPVAGLAWGWIEEVGRRHYIPVNVLVEAAVLDYALARGWPHPPPPRRAEESREPLGEDQGGPVA